MEEEIWKQIPDNVGYEISSLGRVKSLKWGKERIMKLHLNKVDKYLIVRFNKKTFRIHKLIAIVFLGHTPDGYKIVVDHINNNRTDNRLSNIQLITARENTSKDKIGKGSSKFTGVSWCKSRNKWVSRITIGNKYKSLGYFKSEQEAAYAYQSALNSL